MSCIINSCFSSHFSFLTIMLKRILKLQNKTKSRVSCEVEWKLKKDCRTLCTDFKKKLMKIINSMTNAPKKYTRYNIFFKGFKVQKG